jgi:hypothetical protein
MGFDEEVIGLRGCTDGTSLGLSVEGFVGGAVLVAGRIIFSGVGRLELGGDEAGIEILEKEGGPGLCSCVGFDRAGLC